MDTAEKELVIAEVTKFITEDYASEFLGIYGMCISLAEAHPEQVNTEIRNSITHISRALKKQTLDTAQHEIKRARGHLERGMRDCLKLCVIERYDNLRQLIILIEINEGVVHRKYKRRLLELEKMRKNIFVSESIGDEAVNPLLDLLNHSNELYDTL